MCFLIAKLYFINNNLYVFNMIPPNQVQHVLKISLLPFIIQF